VITGTPAIVGLIPLGTSVRAGGDFKVAVQTISVGLNYRFNLGSVLAPIMARY
jgi:hypothetical protein